MEFIKNFEYVNYRELKNIDTLLKEYVSKGKRVLSEKPINAFLIEERYDPPP
jgi:hypothetical protein